MATETLHFENARFAQQLFNHEPRNLQALEIELGVKATSREGWIKLDGPADGIERAKQLFASLQNLLQAGSPVKNREFTHALNVVKHEGATMLKDMVSDRVTTHERKPSVTAAGTGKTFLAVAMALSALREGSVSRIILTRPAVEAGEALGFLPGDLLEKITPYLRPLHDALHDMLPADEIAKHMERATIEIAPLAYMRGRTLNGAFIILDEAQNSTTEQMLMFLTRLGHGSKAVITGDETQIDLPTHKHSGLAEAHRALKHTEGIAIMEFSKRDVVRHPLVQRIIAAYEEHRGNVKPE
jgi:phosphate starvation-inducible PhoH-like protein